MKKKLWMLFLVLAAVTAIPEAQSGRLPDEVMRPAALQEPVPARENGFDWAAIGLAAVALASAASIIKIGTANKPSERI